MGITGGNGDLSRKGKRLHALSLLDDPFPVAVVKSLAVYGNFTLLVNTLSSLAKVPCTLRLICLVHNMHQHVHYMHTNMYIPQGDSLSPMLYTVVFQPCHALYIPALYKVCTSLVQSRTSLVQGRLVQGWCMFCTRLLHDWYMPGA